MATAAAFCARVVMSCLLVRYFQKQTPCMERSLSSLIFFSSRTFEGFLLLEANQQNACSDFIVVDIRFVLWVMGIHCYGLYFSVFPDIMTTRVCLYHHTFDKQ